MNVLAIFVSIGAVSLVSLLGIVSLQIKKEFLQKVTFVLVSFAVGALLGDAFIHLIPEAFEELGLGSGASLLVLAGILLFFLLEKVIRWHHCHDFDCHDHKKPVAYMNLVGDGVHNLLDGMIIASSYALGFEVGLATTIAVLFHEIPQEMGDFGVLIHGGFSISKALLFNLISALVAFIGAILVIVIGQQSHEFHLYLLPIAAGGFLYIASSDLIPELHKQKSTLVQVVFILLGITVMYLLTLVE